MAALAWPGLVGNSVTVDEFAHMPAGYLTLREGAFHLYSKTPPLVRSVAAVPWVVSQPAIAPELQRHLDPYDAWHPWVLGDEVMQRNPKIYDSLFRRSRAVTLSLALLGGVIVWHWSRELFGARGALLSLALYATSPTLLAHSSVATVDVGAAALFTGSLFGLWQFLHHPTRGRALFLGLLLGAAVTSKFTALILVPLVIAITIVAAFQKQRFKDYALGIAIALVVTLLVVNIVYGFRGSLTSWGSHQLFSQTLTGLTGWLPDWLPAGLPGWFLFGLDAQLLDLEQGEFPSYLLGEWSEQSRWFYFPVALASKETIPFQILLVVSFATYFFRRPRDLLGELCLLIPVAVFAVVALQGGRLQSGIRYLLPIFLLLLIHVGRVAVIIKAFPEAKKRRLATTVLGALLVWQIGTVVAGQPDYLSYFNQVSGGPMNGHRILLDSNLDWGQDLERAAAWCREEDVKRPFLAYFGHVDPRRYGLDYVLPPGRPSAGTYLVSANYLYGMPYPATWTGDWSQQIDVTWLEKFEPVARIGRSIFVFQIE